MHTFAEYAPRLDAQVAELVRHNPLAAMISTDHGVPVASHVPVITPPSRLHAGGARWGHMARVNPQWQTFDPARPVLLIFTGAHAYVSPALYQREPTVPTWNYSSVHVTALPQILPQGEPTMQVLTQTVQAVEAVRGNPRDMSASPARFHQIVGGVVAFSLRITAVPGGVQAQPGQPGRALAAGSRRARRRSGLGAGGPRHGRGPAGETAGLLPGFLPG
jgi:transcriptional regulator